MAEGTAVLTDAKVFGDTVVLTIAADGMPTIPVTQTPQQAFELGEKLARCAHSARFPGEKSPDGSYLMQQIKSRVTEQMGEMLDKRLEVMLNSLREDKTWSNAKLAHELRMTVFNKVA